MPGLAELAQGDEQSYNSIVRHSPALLVCGILERGDGGVTSLLADQLDILNLAIVHSSRDFR